MKIYPYMLKYSALPKEKKKLSSLNGYKVLIDTINTH